MACVEVDVCMYVRGCCAWEMLKAVNVVVESITYFVRFFFITKIYINVLKGFVFFHFRLFFRFTMVAEISGFIY